MRFQVSNSSSTPCRCIRKCFSHYLHLLSLTFFSDALYVKSAVVEDGKVVNDARGAVFQFVSSFDNSPIAMNDDGTYKGNVVSDMQIMVAYAIKLEVLANTPELQTGVNSINDAIIDWAGSGTDVYTPAYRCNGDSMHHGKLYSFGHLMYLQVEIVPIVLRCRPSITDQFFCLFFIISKSAKVWL